MHEQVDVFWAAGGSQGDELVEAGRGHLVYIRRV
jgi:hypothetical protein